MIIKQLKATFGKLSDHELILNDGLNVIYAPNESGKSTWCAFLRAMLYGVDTAERAKAGMLPDKTKYQPWNGRPMEGVMELSFNGKDISIHRHSKSGPLRSFLATYTGTGEPVPGLTGNNAGEVLTGVSKAVFERSAYVRQSALAVSSAPELEKRITDIVSTGDDETSYKAASEKLKAWQKSRRSTGRRGKIHELEDEINSIRDRIEMIRELEKSQEETKILLSEARFKRDELQKKVEAGRMKRRDEVRSVRARNKEELNNKRQDVEASRQAQISAEDSLRESRFGLRDPADFQSDILGDADRARQLKLEAESEGNLIHALIAGAATAVFSLIALFNSSFLIAAFLCLAITGFFIFNYRKIKQLAKLAAGEYQALMDKYNAQGPDDIVSALNSHSELWLKYISAKDAVAACERELEDCRKSKEAEDDALVKSLDFSRGDDENALLTRALDDANRELQSIRESLAMITGRMDNIGAVKALESELSKKQRDIDAIALEYDAITLALNTLSEANTEIQTRFSPKLGKKATEIFSRITGGRYDQMTLNRELRAMAKRRDDITPREAIYLSAGALDQLYLALRLAICELALPEDTRCPLILDDVLVNFDKERAALTMDYLKEVAQLRQVIFFTCRNELSYTATLLSADL